MSHEIQREKRIYFVGRRLNTGPIGRGARPGAAACGGAAGVHGRRRQRERRCHRVLSIIHES